MNERRSLIDIYADILESIDRGCRKTHIVYQANLNSNRCKRYMGELIKSGLVGIQSNSPLAWVITDRGREFLEKYREFKELFTKPKKVGKK